MICCFLNPSCLMLLGLFRVFMLLHVVAIHVDMYTCVVIAHTCRKSTNRFLTAFVYEQRKGMNRDYRSVNQHRCGKAIICRSLSYGNHGFSTSVLVYPLRRCGAAPVNEKCPWDPLEIREGRVPRVSPDKFRVSFVTCEDLPRVYNDQRIF
jgi:hypothetical protein